MRLALLLLAGLAPLLFAAAMIGAFRVAARESREEERRPCSYCELRRLQCRHVFHA